MLVSSLVLAKRGFGRCKRWYKSTTIILLVQIKHTSWGPNNRLDQFQWEFHRGFHRIKYHQFYRHGKESEDWSLWHICLNAAKHLSHVIHESDEKGNKFLSYFKNCVYEDRSESYFIEKWQQLLAKYNLQNNFWMANL